ncbi:hypothetical protein [Rhizobacter fulvus]|jgi:hypothetical protein
MRNILIPAALASLFALAACDKPAVVAVPAPSPAPSTVVVPGPPGQPGPQGEAGKAGDTTVIVTPPASAASN